MLSISFPLGPRAINHQTAQSRRRANSISRRVPLQELPTTPSGTLVNHRSSTFRPLPSRDKENVHAFYLANRSRHGYLVSRLEVIARRITRAHRVQDRTLRSLGRLALRPRKHRQHRRRRRRNADQTAVMPHTRLSMPEISDDSGSEPDLSILELARARAGDILARRNMQQRYDVHGQSEAEDTSIGEDLVDEDGAVGIEEDEEEEEEEEEDGEHVEEEEEEEEEEALQEVLADPAALGLKEISNLGRFTVSSHKQGNGVEQLRSDDLNLYWQSDGPQPHKLTVYFVKRVGIRELRFYVNYAEDESYTPTNIVFKSGTSENNLIEFAHLELHCPVGWQRVPLAGAGGGPDGNTLVSYVLQIQILENHQNGKDTHLRGIKIYAFDVDSSGAGQAQVGGESTSNNNPVDEVVEMVGGGRGSGGSNAVAAVGDEGHDGEEGVGLSGLARKLAETGMESAGEGEAAGFTIPDFMRDPEIR